MASFEDLPFEIRIKIFRINARSAFKKRIRNFSRKLYRSRVQWGWDNWRSNNSFYIESGNSFPPGRNRRIYLEAGNASVEEMADMLERRGHMESHDRRYRTRRWG
jgi:hypothetical protein